MMRVLVLSLLLAVPSARAADALGNVGSVRGDYWMNFNEFELNLVLSALPFIDVEAGLLLPSSNAHLALGPRFEVLSRHSEGGATVRIVLLFGGWVSLGGAVRLTDFSASPGVEATYWFAKNFGITGSISVPMLVPYADGELRFQLVRASPRLGVGLSF